MKNRDHWYTKQRVGKFVTMTMHQNEESNEAALGSIDVSHFTRSHSLQTLLTWYMVSTKLSMKNEKVT